MDYVIMRQNGGSPSACATYYETFTSLSDAKKACDEIYAKEEDYCSSNHGAWHREAVYVFLDVDDDGYPILGERVYEP